MVDDLTYPVSFNDHSGRCVAGCLGVEGNDGKWGDELGGFAAIQVREMKTGTWETAVVKSGQILGVPSRQILQYFRTLGTQGVEW